MTTTPRTLAIVGASLAGAKAAEAARDAGYAGRVVLIGDESSAPYERPPLSKSVLRGDAVVDTARVHDDGFYAEHGIELINSRVTALDDVSRRLQLDDGAVIPFDTAILATGAAPRSLDMPGADLAHVHYLRTIDDAVRLGHAIRKATRVAVIGAGWIGSEVAASARQMGSDVVLIDSGHVPLRRVLGDRIGEVFRQLHADHGVDLRLGVGVSELRGAEAVEEVVLADGRIEPADVVVAGVGVIPRVELAAESFGFRVDNGIVVDQYMETNVAGIYAAGDVANAWHPHYRRYVRVEHWANALNQGLVAGRNAAGQHDPYSRLPYFFSDQYDLGMEYVGYAQADDELVVRGDLAEREFVAFWHRHGIVTAAMHVNTWDVVEDLRAVIEAGVTIDPARLRDPNVTLGELLAPTARVAQVDG
jgi:3-phenylpropionate/trans-cinnamate dioxygenase ferredoxin reductase subunit